MPSSSQRLTIAVAAALVALVGAAPVAAQEGTGSVVVTTEVLGSVVEQMVGDAAEVTVVMPSGANPHSYEPSARDAERMLGADVLVSNGLDLEEALLSIMERAQAEGVTWFQAADRVATREIDEAALHEAQDDGTDDHEAEMHDADEEGADHAAVEGHDHGAEDPHIWTDPMAMIDVVEALSPVLAEAGIEAAGADALIADLQSLDAQVSEIVSVVPAAERQLVTGHESLGYFARRYGFDLVGTVIPGLSTSGEPTARELAQLIEDIRTLGVTAVFSEVGTPQAVAEAVAADSGAELVPLPTSQLPEGGTYQDLIRDIATTVAGALAGTAR